MAEIELSENLINLQRTLITRCETIETQMAKAIDIADWSQVETKLNELLVLLPTCSKMMEDGVLLYDTSKGFATELFLKDSKLCELKQQLLIKWFEGKLAKVNSVYTRTERCCANLVKAIEGYRSILSFEKEQMKNLIHTPQQ